MGKDILVLSQTQKVSFYSRCLFVVFSPVTDEKPLSPFNRTRRHSFVLWYNKICLLRVWIKYLTWYFSFVVSSNNTKRLKVAFLSKFYFFCLVSNYVLKRKKMKSNLSMKRENKIQRRCLLYVSCFYLKMHFIFNSS